MKPKNYFQEVCELLESGFTICQAIDQLEIDSRSFYKSITKEQRLHLAQLKAANTGIVHRGYENRDDDTKDLHEFFTTEYI